jgi:hypothetical protein
MYRTFPKTANFLSSCKISAEEKEEGFCASTVLEVQKIKRIRNKYFIPIFLKHEIKGMFIAFST